MSCNNDLRITAVATSLVQSGRFVKGTPSATVPTTAAADALTVLGVSIQTTVSVNALVAVIVDGEAQCECADATIVYGDALTINAVGQVVKQATTPVTPTVAFALEAGSALDNGLGKLIRCKLAILPRIAVPA